MQLLYFGSCFVFVLGFGWVWKVLLVLVLLLFFNAVHLLYSIVILVGENDFKALICLSEVYAIYIQFILTQHLLSVFTF